MTTTAHEDQFTDAPEPVRQPYDAGSILRRNVADLEIALKQQAERAEKAEAELERLREQKPVAWDCGGSITANSGYAEWFSRKDHGAAVPLYTSPVPAPAVPASGGKHPSHTTRSSDSSLYDEKCVNCGGTDVAGGGWGKLAQPCKAAPSVPEDWREAAQQLIDAASVMLDAQPFITAETYGGRYIVAMRFERLGKMQDCHAALLALLQSAEVRHD